jgi:hypothetical protein
MAAAVAQGVRLAVRALPQDDRLAEQCERLRAGIELRHRHDGVPEVAQDVLTGDQHVMLLLYCVQTWGWRACLRRDVASRVKASLSRSE